MQLDPHAIQIYTDGSCYGNPGGVAGAAALVVYPDHMNRNEEEIVDFGCAESTNNRMELLACIRALQWVRQHAAWTGITRVQMITDSVYVKDNLQRAMGWKANGWRNRYGHPVENRDLWKQLLSAYAKAGIRVTFEWALGKSLSIAKEVDQLSKKAAKRGGPDVDAGYRPGTVAHSIVKGSATRYPARGQKAVIRIYRKQMMGRGEEKIRFDLFSEEKQVFVASYYAFATSSLAATLHRQHCYRVRFNADKNYPKIVELTEEVPVPKNAATATAS
jgi:ribonuclease HI